MKNVLVIGSLNTDFSINTDKIPSPGETVNANNLIINNGGKGANQAYTIGKLGGNVSMLGMVGNDIYGKDLIKALKSVKVNTKGISLNKSGSTGKAFIYVDNNGENSISIIHGANYAVDKRFIDKNISLINKADIILMQLEIPLETVNYVLEIAKDKTIILDPAPANKELMNFDLSNVFLMKPNETELATLTGYEIKDDEDVIRACNILLEKGVKNVIASLGSKGCYLVNKNNNKFFDSVKSNAIDTTAAGDSFIASIAFFLSQNKSIEESIIFASKVASIVVTRKGAQNSIPSIKEVI